MLSELRAHLAQADLRGGAVLVTANATNMKTWNGVVGREAGDRYLGAMDDRLRRVADGCWRVAGDEFLAVFHGDLERVRERLLGLSYALHGVVGATLGWRFGFPSGETSPFVPSRLVEVQVTPRFGFVALGHDALVDLEGAASRSREHAEAHAEAAFQADWAPLTTGSWRGFAPLLRGLLTRKTIQQVACPRCGVPDVEVEDLDTGVTAERCGVCGSRYERYDHMVVFGEEREASFT
jgi:GGDEF domain-containing protein